jgi:transposase-like protein
MDRDWLEAQLTAGRSIEEIAREAGRHPSTVAYWVEKHGLESGHAQRHRPRGGIPRELLEDLIAEGLSIREMAARLDRGYSTVRHWLGRYGLVTHRAAMPRESTGDYVERVCPDHGLTRYVRYGEADSFRCLQCRKNRVVRRRRDVKAILVAEAGGACVLCGYDRYIGALQFHHLDPSTKEFGLGLRGVARSLERCRAEARKCVLLCGNCHAEVEAGFAELGCPGSPGDRGSSLGQHGPG